MHVPILEAIAAAKMAAVGNVAPIAFLLTHQGRPYSAGISNAIRAWCRQAGCHIAPLIRSRKGTLTMLADKSRRVAHPTGFEPVTSAFGETRPPFFPSVFKFPIYG